MGRGLELLIRIAFAAVYAYAAVGKIEDPYAFARAIYNYRLLPDAALVPLALTLPVLELLAAAAILIGFPYRGSVLILGGLSLVFAGAVGSAVIRGIDLSCGCFGTHAESQADWAHVAGNLVGFLAALWLLRRSGRGPLRSLWAADPHR